MLSEYDEGKMAEIFRNQMNAGSNYLTVRFRGDAPYQSACALLDNDFAGLNALLDEVGYEGGYYYWYDDQLRTFSVGIYAAV